MSLPISQLVTNLTPFGRHQIDAALDDLLVQLHVGDAVHEQPADAVGAFVDGHLMAGRVQLRGAGQPGRPGPDHRHLLAGALRRGLRHDPAFLEALVDDRRFDVLDRHRRLDDAQRTRAFARRRADAAGKFREVVGLVQPVQRLLPVAAIDQIVPFRDQVVDRAARRHPADQRAGVAERNAAIHAARALLLQLVVAQVQMKLVPIMDAFQRIAVRRQFTRVFHKSGWFAHPISFSRCNSGK